MIDPEEAPPGRMRKPSVANNDRTFSRTGGGKERVCVIVGGVLAIWEKPDDNARLEVILETRVSITGTLCEIDSGGGSRVKTSCWISRGTTWGFLWVHTC